MERTNCRISLFTLEDTKALHCRNLVLSLARSLEDRDIIWWGLAIFSVRVSLRADAFIREGHWGRWHNGATSSTLFFSRTVSVSFFLFFSFITFVFFLFSAVGQVSCFLLTCNMALQNDLFFSSLLRQQPRHTEAEQCSFEGGLQTWVEIQSQWLRKAKNKLMKWQVSQIIWIF